MNRLLIVPALLTAGAVLLPSPAGAQTVVPVKPNPPPKHTPPPVQVRQPKAGAGQSYVYDQKPMGGGRPVLVKPDQAYSIIERFKAAYPKLGSPRMLLYINRDWVDPDTTPTQEDVPPGTNAAPQPAPSEPSNMENRYRHKDRKQASLPDRQTTRDVERLVGRPLRMGGAVLIDQRLATEVMPEGGIKSLQAGDDQARKDLEALSKIAEVVVEVLISSKVITATGISGDRTYTIPDIQATALQLKNARVLGQAASLDVLGKQAPISQEARYLDVREITEATTLALMEDMLTGVEAPAQPEKK